VVWGSDYDDGSLLAVVSQRGHQPPLLVRLAHSQVLPAPLEIGALSGKVGFSRRVELKRFRWTFSLSQCTVGV
jgi:hypothetical protein